MTKVFVAGSRKFSKEINKFIKECKKNKIEAILPNKKLGKLNLKEENKSLLEAFKIIENSDLVYILAKGGYIGKTVKKEVLYANNKNKKIIASENILDETIKHLVNKTMNTKEFTKKTNPDSKKLTSKEE